MKALFASVHSCLDPTSGAAVANRDVLRMLSERGHSCRAVCCTVTDHDLPIAPEAVVAPMGLPARRAVVEGTNRETIEVMDGAVRVALVPTQSSRFGPSPTQDEAQAWLDLAELAIESFRPDVVLTYGGHPASLELMRRARRRGTRTAFHLHNFGYPHAWAFADADVVVVPSKFSQKRHREALGLETVVLPYPIDPAQVVADRPEPTYLTFVNPQRSKGLTVFARIALELSVRRPDLPLLVVEGRGRAEGLSSLSVDLSGLRNLRRMENVPGPRAFWGLTKAALAPSLWLESFGRVVAEALTNGVPVLASDRGALPEALGDAGLVLPLPEWLTPEGDELPTAREVEPWTSAIERLWDDPAYYERHRRKALAEAGRWSPDRLVEAYLRALGGDRSA